MAEAASGLGARIRFVSLPSNRPFPLAATHVSRSLREAHEVGAQALIIDSIAAAFLGAWRLREIDMPLVGSLHQPPGGIDHSRTRTVCQAALDRRTYRACRILIAASDSLASELTAQGFPADAIRTVPPGRDVAPGHVPAKLDLRNGRAIAVLTVGNWIPRKGIACALEAVSRLPMNCATLHLAGDDTVSPSYAARLRARIAAPDLSGRVVIHGPVTLAEVSNLYSGADVFLLPSFAEPFGTVWGEAMDCGLPVVGWAAGNLKHLASDGKEGFLARLNDVAGLADAMWRLSQDSELRMKMGRAAACRAATRPTWTESARMFFSAVREATGAGAKH
jgi:glycosyltransferase involved in cell wall biosynthesis